MSFQLEQPVWLWLLVLAVPIVWLGMRSLNALDPVRRWTAIGLRLAVVVVLTLMLARLSAVQTHSQLTVMVAMDTSASVQQFVQPPDTFVEDAGAAAAVAGGTGQDRVYRWLRQLVREASRDRPEDDLLGWLVFDGEARVTAWPSPGVLRDEAAVVAPVEGTNIADAIRQAMAVMRADAPGRILLISDGNDTAGAGVGDVTGDADVLAAAREARAKGIVVDVLPLPYEIRREVMVEGVYAPTEAREGRSAAVRVVLSATEPAPGVLELLHDGVRIDLNGSEPDTGLPVGRSEWAPAAAGDSGAGRYVLAKQLTLPLPYPGMHRFKAIFTPAGGDTNAVNNQGETFTLVSGRGKVLLVNHLTYTPRTDAGVESGDGGGPPVVRQQELAEALRSRQIELEEVGPSGLPATLADLRAYDAVILQNVPEREVDPTRQEALAQYVRDLGGGLVVIGGPDGFGAGGWGDTELDRTVFPIHSRVPSQRVLPSGALVIVLDRSSSMSSPVGGSGRSQQQLANSAAALAIRTLYPDDHVGVVAFDTAAKWIVQLGPNTNTGDTIRKVEAINPGGGTDIASGLDAAYRVLNQLKTTDTAVKHIILLTDGQSMNPPGGWPAMAARIRAAGISVSTVGVGDGHDAGVLKALASDPSMYHAVRNPNSLPQVFIKEAKTIRKNMIKEVDFTPGWTGASSPVLAGMRATPPLKGLVVTTPRTDPRVYLPLVGPEGEPLFAHWQVGLGRAAAWTSDATSRWAAPWVGWPGYADFWSRTVRAMARPAPSRDVDLTAAIRGDRLVVRMDMTGAEEMAGGGEFLDVEAAVLTPDNESLSVRLRQVGPGLYEGSVPAKKAGSYVVEAVGLAGGPGGGGRVRAVTGTARPVGVELARFESNIPLLEQVAEITGGRTLDPLAARPAGLFDRTQEFITRSPRPMWRQLMWLLLPLLLLDVACRRIAWDAGAAWAWSKRRVAAVFASRRPKAEESKQTMDALKARRDAARTSMSSEREQDARPAAAERRALFEAPADDGEPSFTATAGAQKAGPAAKPAATQDGKPDADRDEGPTTSRLLDAKRRARDRYVDRE